VIFGKEKKSGSKNKEGLKGRWKGKTSKSNGKTVAYDELHLQKKNEIESRKKTKEWRKEKSEEALKLGKACRETRVHKGR